MAKPRVKKRTHAGAGTAAAGNKAAAKPGTRPPKSMVIRVGASDVGPSVSQLVHDVRSMMEPDTASRLKERRSNKLRDYTTMAGPLGVTHLMLFSRSESGNTNLRLALTPRGPTLHFRVEKYSLCKDIYQSMKRPKSGGTEYLTAPLLVMNNFTTKEPAAGEEKKGTQPKIPKHLENLTTSIFQSLFPPINPTSASLKSMKRVLLLDRIPQDPTSDSDLANYTINLRHFAIETRTAKSVPKPLRRLDAAEKLAHAGQKRKRGGLPNLGMLNDVADYLLDPQAAEGFTSASESEPDTDAEVEILAAKARKSQKLRAKGGEDGGGEVKRERRTEVVKKGIKLYELGPRMRLRLTKVEEGVCGGKVMWHEYIHKSKEEVKEMERVHERQRQERAARQREQKENVERKKKARGEGGKAGGEGDDDDEGVEGGEMEDDEWDDDEMLEDDNGRDEEMDDGE